MFDRQVVFEQGVSLGLPERLVAVILVAGLGADVLAGLKVVPGGAVSAHFVAVDMDLGVEALAFDERGKPGPGYIDSLIVAAVGVQGVFATLDMGLDGIMGVDGKCHADESHDGDDLSLHDDDFG